jgi:hypothetical protein
VRDSGAAGVPDAVSEAGLEPDLLEDCVVMASELAASTLRAQAVAEAGGGGDRLASATAGVEGEPIVSAGPAPSGGPSSAQRAMASATRW